MHRYLRRLKNQLANYRVMYEGETLQQGDLICKLVRGKRTWVPCDTTSLGTSVAKMSDICARQLIDPCAPDPIEANIDALEQMFLGGLKIVAKLKFDYARQKLNNAMEASAQSKEPRR